MTREQDQGLSRGSAGRPKHRKLYSCPRWPLIACHGAGSEPLPLGFGSRRSSSSSALLGIHLRKPVAQSLLGWRHPIPKIIDHFRNLLVLRGLFLRLHLHDVELLCGIGAQDGGLAFQDFHDQQAGLAVYLLDRTLEEHLQQLVETIQIERDDPQLRSVIDLGQRTIEPPGPAKKSSRPSFEAPRSIIGG